MNEIATPLPATTVGDCVLDEGNARLTRDGTPIDMPPKAFAVLAHLVRHHHRLVTKDELLDAIWGHGHVSESVLKTVINQLRTLLNDDPRTPRYIETATRRGYRLVAQVAPLAKSAAPPKPADGLPPAIL